MEPNLKFKAFRKRLGPTQLEFSQKTGIARSTIADVERGRIGLSAKAMSKIDHTFPNEAGYFERQNTASNVQINQGSESGLNQGKSILKASFKHWKVRKLDPIESYLGLDIIALKGEIAIEIEDLKELYENYKKLLEAIYKIDPPAFFKKKFPLVTDFEHYKKRIESEYQPIFSQDGKENSFTLIHKIFDLYKSEQEHCKNLLTLLIDYFNRYSDFFLDDNGIKESLKG